MKWFSRVRRAANVDGASSATEVTAPVRSTATGRLISGPRPLQALPRRQFARQHLQRNTHQQPLGPLAHFHAVEAVRVVAQGAVHLPGDAEALCVGLYQQGVGHRRGRLHARAAMQAHGQGKIRQREFEQVLRGVRGRAEVEQPHRLAAAQGEQLLVFGRRLEIARIEIFRQEGIAALAPGGVVGACMAAPRQPVPAQRAEGHGRIAALGRGDGCVRFLGLRAGRVLGPARRGAEAPAHGVGVKHLVLRTGRIAGKGTAEGDVVADGLPHEGLRGAQWLAHHAVGPVARAGHHEALAHVAHGKPHGHPVRGLAPGAYALPISSTSTRGFGGHRSLSYTGAERPGSPVAVSAKWIGCWLAAMSGTPRWAGSA